MTTKTADLVAPDAPVLHTVAKPVRLLSKLVLDRASTMIETMVREGGIGIAAPQIGWSARVLAIGVPGSEALLFNPVLISKSAETTETDEGCLSARPPFFPEKWTVKRTRSVQVRIRADVANGNKFSSFEADLAGLPAIVFQHELDHLDGITIWDQGK